MRNFSSSGTGIQKIGRDLAVSTKNRVAPNETDASKRLTRIEEGERALKKVLRVIRDSHCWLREQNEGGIYYESATATFLQFET